MSDNRRPPLFTATKLAVMDLIARDGSMTDLDVRIAWLVFTRMNPNTEDAWPGIDLLAVEAGVEARSVRRSLGRLVLKYLVVEKGGKGPKDTNRYSINAEIRRTVESALGAKSLTPESEKGDSTVRKGGPQSQPNPLKNPPKNPVPPPGSRVEKAVAWMASQPAMIRLNGAWAAKDAGDTDPFAWQLAAWEAAGCPGGAADFCGT